MALGKGDRAVLDILAQTIQNIFDGERLFAHGISSFWGLWFGLVAWGRVALSGAAREGVRGLWSVKTGFKAHAVLLFELVIGAAGDGVCAALLVVGYTAPAELREIVAERTEIIMLAVV